MNRAKPSQAARTRQALPKQTELIALALELAVLGASHLNRPLPPLAHCAHALSCTFRGEVIQSTDIGNASIVYQICSFKRFPHWPGKFDSYPKELIAIAHYNHTITLRHPDRLNEVVASVDTPSSLKPNGICQLWNEPALAVANGSGGLFRLDPTQPSGQLAPLLSAVTPCAQLVCLATLPDGDTIVGCEYNKAVRFFSVLQKKETRTVLYQATCCALSPCGRKLAVTSFMCNAVSFLDVATGGLSEPLMLDVSRPAGIAWLRSGALLIGSHTDKAPFLLLDAQAAANEHRVQHSQRPGSQLPNSIKAWAVLELVDGRVVSLGYDGDQALLLR